MPFYERQPHIQPLYQILLEVMNGNIRVPRFQRPGTQSTWEPEQRQALLDSLYRGYPIGTILLWTTTMDITSQDTICGFQIPALEKGKTVQYLLDGHQRLSSLVQILGNGLLPGSDSQKNRQQEESWYFDVIPSEVLATTMERFIWLRPDQPPGKFQLPLDIVLNRSALNRWVRERTNLTEAQIKDVDDLRDRLREYNIPVAILLADTLEDATESFKRINSSGTPMSYFNMVAALAYQENFDPQEKFAQARENYLTPLGWTDVSDSDILRVCVGIFKDDPTRLKVDDFAKKLKADNSVVERAVSAIAKAASLLKGIGIHGPAILPYTWQLIVFAIVCSESQCGVIEESVEKLAIERWFWLTTYGEVFSGGNKSVIFQSSKQALISMLGGGTHQAMQRYMQQSVRPVTRFDFRSVRAKACLLTMATLQDQGNKQGKAHLALIRGNDSVQSLISGGKRSDWWQLAITSGAEQTARFRASLINRYLESEIRDIACTDPNEQEILRQAGIPLEAEGDALKILTQRRDVIIEQEKTVIAELGLKWQE